MKRVVTGILSLFFVMCTAVLLDIPAEAATEITTSETWSGVAKTESVTIKGGNDPNNPVVITVNGTTKMEHNMTVSGCVKFVGTDNERLNTSGASVSITCDPASNVQLTIENLIFNGSGGITDVCIKSEPDEGYTHSISLNNATVQGYKSTDTGSICISGNSSLTMNNSIVKTANIGVNVGDSASFTMIGGSITNNITTYAVQTTSNSGDITVGGAAQISDLYLADGKTISIDNNNSLSTGASVKITPAAAITGDSGIIVATGASSGDADYFSSSNTNLSASFDSSSNTIKLKPTNPDNYYIWVNGTKVTESNATDITCSSGTASYANSTNTLTLNNATINSSFTVNGNSCGIYINQTCQTCNEFTINLVGDNKISFSNPEATYGILSTQNLKFTGDGTLTINGVKYGISTDGTLAVSGPTLTVDSTSKALNSTNTTSITGSYQWRTSSTEEFKTTSLTQTQFESSYLEIKPYTTGGTSDSTTSPSDSSQDGSSPSDSSQDGSSPSDSSQDGSSTDGSSTDGSSDESGNTDSSDDASATTPDVNDDDPSDTQSTEGTNSTGGNGSADGSNSNSANGDSADNENNDNLPYIKNDSQLRGWDKIISVIQKADDKDVVEVNTNSSAIIPEAVLKALKDKNVTLVLELNDDICWKINGLGVKKAQETDLGITLSDSAPENGADLAKDKPALHLVFAHQGDLGFEAVLEIKINDDYSKKVANLFYNNGNEFAFAYDVVVTDSVAQITMNSTAESMIVFANGVYNGVDFGDNPMMGASLGVAGLAACSAIALFTHKRLRKRRKRSR